MAAPPSWLLWLIKELQIAEAQRRLSVQEELKHVESTFPAFSSLGYQLYPPVYSKTSGQLGSMNHGSPLVS